MATKRKGPGVFETMRQGWASPAQKRAAAAAAGAPKPGSAAGKTGARRRGAAAAGAHGSDPGASSMAAPALVKRRDELSRRYAELQWDLGGIAYEMARRDHYRLEVLNAQAAKLQQVDAELGQIERLVKLDQAGAASSCPSCGALQARGASFCWSCGKELKPTANASSSADAAGATTATAATDGPATAEAKTAPPEAEWSPKAKKIQAAKGEGEGS